VVSDCLFCKIGRGEVPTDIVREDEQFVAFRDINPQAPTHILAIPRQHVPSLNEATDAELIGNLVLFARDVAGDEGIHDAGYRVVLNTNSDGGQTVFHVHAHVLGGRTLAWPPG
jgi:histidine triad (HIT) family protein